MTRPGGCLCGRAIRLNPAQTGGGGLGATETEVTRHGRRRSAETVPFRQVTEAGLVRLGLRGCLRR